jgi:hypothetical protein
LADPVAQVQAQKSGIVVLLGELFEGRSPPSEELLNKNWRRHPDSNWRISALQAVALPLGYAAFKKNGAGNEIRTRDFNLGKVALYH